ncbi:GntR family transcriptional regulator [Tropicimonas sp. TH_r6]|uniref:GntR family transcriptional regulator n=1 Tax=Tropicimonas sp. TH_r6 TaxID=3082085 RepID=UPI0029552DEB|nr:GntR family transcriptional regulator [Tropicimonas sp. TH_r6]MDV7144827.1 GntR family transcriptional regulator [Tropicimonas sp. TH_r6]
MQAQSKHISEDLSGSASVTQLLSDATLDLEKNITFQIFDILRELIVSVRLRPGQRLSEKEIAAALKASKTPVREAMIRLDEIRLVKIVPQSGTYVTKISINRYRTACFIRLHLEIGAVRNAASGIALQVGLQELETLLSRQTEALASEDYERFFDLDEAFHRQLFVMAGYVDAWTTARRTQFDVNRARHIRRLNRILRVPTVLEEHRAIAEAIRAGDPERAEAALRTHIGDLDHQISLLVRDERMLGFIEMPEPT